MSKMPKPRIVRLKDVSIEIIIGEVEIEIDIHKKT